MTQIFNYLLIGGPLDGEVRASATVGSQPPTHIRVQAHSAARIDDALKATEPKVETIKPDTFIYVLEFLNLPNGETRFVYRYSELETDIIDMLLAGYRRPRGTISGA